MAKADLKAIAIFSEERWGKDQRNSYVKQFNEAFHLLSQSPAAGKACDYIRSGYRKFPLGSHIIFYTASNSEEIRVVRILHKHMDVDAKFLHP